MPLILPSQRVIRPNPLAYPAGAVPGIDRSHPAAQNLRMSAVFVNGNFLDITTGEPSSIQGTPTVGIDGGLGPYGQSRSGTADAYFFANKPAVLDTQCTMAVIVRTKNNTGSQQFHFVSGTSGNNYFHLSNNGDAWNFGAGGSAVTAITISGSSNNGHVYFQAASMLASGVGFMVVSDLTNGKVYTGTAAIGPNTQASTGSYQLGNYNFFSVPDNNPISAGMYAANAITPAQLSAWAADPWSFWYPRRTIQYTTPANTTTTTGGARIRQRFNRSPLAYPAGAVPGVDASHPMSQKLALSAIASNGTVISLLNGVVGTPVNSPGFVTASTLGPSVRILTADSNARITLPWAFSGSTSTGYTQAAIFSIASAEAFNYLFCDRDQSGGNNNICIRSSDSVNNLCIESQGNTSDTGCFVGATSGPFGVPYFVAWSAFPDNTARVVVKNLLTGQVQSNTFALGAATSVLTSGTTSIGGRSNDASRCWNGNIAAVAMSGQALSLAQLLQWAKSPWEFWYPNKTINLASAAASVGASFLPVWAYRYNLPVLGTGNF